MDDEHFAVTERRRERTSRWYGRRSGDFFSNPIVMAVVAGLIINAAWAIGIFVWQAGVDATHEYWRKYSAGIAAEANYTNDPHRLREIIAKVQEARPKE